MSTYLHLACLSHDPPLLAEDESTQHRHRDEEMDDVSEWVRDRVVLLQQWDDGEIPDWYECVRRDERDFRGYFRAHSLKFLALHRACRIGARDENGEWVDVGYGTPAPRDAHEPAAGSAAGGKA